jgi:hypothetical protein
MKKLIVAMTVAFIGIGGSAVSAQTIDPLPGAPDPLPIECNETDVGTDVDNDRIPDQCVQFYVNQAPPPAIDVGGFIPVCVKDAPFVSYNIVPVGFTPTQPVKATLTIRDLDNNTVTTLVVNSLTGQFIYPGATVDANGNATDWPGWKKTNTGEWVTDDTDAGLRRGLVITVEVNPTATAQVGYPPASSACANPPVATTLPRTGSGIALPLQIGAVLFVLGGIILVATRRRTATRTA